MERFWNKVKKTETCWVWTGSKTTFGYGRFRLNGKTQHSHRVSWIITNGPIPRSPGRGLFVCHKCDNRLCVRPEHLFLGTHKDNMKDMVKKGRQNKCKGEKNGRSKLTNIQVKQIIEEYHKIKSTRKLATKFGVSRANIQFIIHKKTWAHI